MAYKKSAMHEGQNKIARLISLDKLMRSSSGMTQKEIMNKLDQNVSKRTLQHDLEEMGEIHGAVFVEGELRSGERLWRYKDPTFSIFSQTTNDMEIIRKTIEKLSVFQGDPRYDMLRFYLKGMEDSISDTQSNFMSFDNNNDVMGLEHIEKILDAITRRYPLKITYQSFDKPELKSNIHPYHLRQYNRRWFLFAYEEENDGIRNFALDRIVSLQDLKKEYIPTDIDFDEYFDDIVGVTNYKDREVEIVKIKVYKRSIDYVRTKPIHWSQTELKGEGTPDYGIFQLKVKLNKELEMQLFSYGDAIEVLEPAELRENFTEQVKNLNCFYKV